MSDHFQIALTAHKAGDFATAEAHYRALPASRNAQHNLAVLYKADGRYEEAEALFRAILAEFPDYQHSRHSLAHVLLALERWEEAWPFWEARRYVDHPAIFDPVTDIPEWQGEPVRGKRVVVCAEHGLGDQVLFGRYLPELSALGAQVTVACNVAAVGRLFEHAGYPTRPFTAQRRTLPAADYWVFIGSLPLRLKSFEPAAANYLKFPLTGGGGVGVMGQGDRRYAYDMHRSMGDADAAALLQIGRSLAPQASGARDVLDTAELIAGLDAVVSTDTLAPNLAATIGAPTFVLLPRIAPCWRWGRADRSPWYPQVRTYRQATPGDWAGVIARAKADLPPSSNR